MNHASDEPNGTIDFLGWLHDLCLDLSKQLRFEKTHAFHFALVSLYGSLIELVGCILILMRNNGKLGVPPLFRTFLETCVEFHNLVRDPQYGYFMEANDAKEWLRVLKSAKDTKNPYLAAISTLPDLPEIITKKEQELQELKKQGYEPTDIRTRFKRANMPEEYQSIYNFVCAESHSNKRALINRHADMASSKFEIVYYKNDPDEMYLMYTDAAAGLLVAATLSIHENLNSDALDQVRQFRAKLDAMRSKYME